jgi:hypothetical protein
MPIIEIIVDTKGQSRVQTTGFTGESCRAASRFLEQALGTVSHEQLTPEFHQPEVTQQSSETEPT